jgi:23S rRNA (cytosine1962-C5)-methyltransferase
MTHSNDAQPDPALEGLGTVSDRRVAVRVTPDALRQIRGGSPWLYDGSIVSSSHDGAPGDLAVIFDDDRKFAAIGLWDPDSPIRVKLLHVGAPTTIGPEFWRSRLTEALDRRGSLADDESTTAYRCVHGENDELPGLIVDKYAETLVVKLYSPAWFPHLRDVIDQLMLLMTPERIVLRLSRSIGAHRAFGLRDGQTIVGNAPTGPIRFVERGLNLEADVEHGQKTGHFLDQRDNRALIRGMAEDAEVLDVFASTGGFSVAAAAGGARSVLLVDQSAEALETADQNLGHNRKLRTVRACKVRTMVGDAFTILGDLELREQLFDIVILDPPSFASNQAAVPRALAAYARLTRLALAVVRDGGTLVQSSCSSRVTADALTETVLDAAASCRADVQIVRRTGHALDHPVGFEFGSYLCAVYVSVRSAGTKN